MSSQRMTNWLLLGIFLVLAGQWLSGSGIPAALADTFKLDQCITAVPSDKPAGYVHVVTHNFAGD